MHARDVMTTAVVSVGPGTKLRDIARLLVAKGISAVPVVDESGAPIGMVSEGDLIGRSAADREARRDWWLEMLAEGELLNPDYVASLDATNATAASVMSAPLITVEESADIAEIARLLETYHIKRVPVLRDGRIVGVVSRADLVRALVAAPPAEPGGRPSAEHRLLSEVIASLDAHFRMPPPMPSRPVAVAPATAAETGLSAQHFRELGEQYRNREHRHRDEVRREAAHRLLEELKALTQYHVEEATWRGTLAKAQEAAAHGETEYMLLRFPNALCSDGGRAINAPLSDWPKTLRGEAAEIYLRWERELRPLGFHLTARVLEFPSGFPGDIGLFLSWGA